MIGRLLVLFAIVALSTADYAGYKVFRLNNLTPEQLQYEMDIAEKNEFDVWQASTADGWMDVMVPPSAALFYDGYDKELRFDDLDKLINESMLPNPDPHPFADPIFNAFQRVDEIYNYCNRLVTASGNRLTRTTAGSTYAGKAVNAYVYNHSPTANKPQILIQCGIHAREWIGPPSCMWILDQLVNNPQNLANVTQIREFFEWHIIPVLNVDGYEYTWTSNSNARLWRKTRQPNTNQNCPGTDPNRNYNFEWGKTGASGDQCSETYYGPSAASAPIIRGIQNYLNRLTNCKIFFDNHSYGGYFLSAWGYTSTRPAEYSLMSSYMTAAVANIRTWYNRAYTAGQSSTTLYVTSGSSVDYFYGVHPKQPLGFTIEAFGSSFTPPAADIIPRAQEYTAGIFSVALRYRSSPTLEIQGEN